MPSQRPLWGKLPQEAILHTSQTPCRHHVYQLEKRIVTSRSVSKSSCQSKEGPLVAVCFGAQNGGLIKLNIPLSADGGLLLLD